MAVPFGRRLLEEGVHRSVAVSLFDSGLTTLAQSARIAGISLEAFIQLLGKLSIPAADYPPDELAEELDLAR